MSMTSLTKSKRKVQLLDFRVPRVVQDTDGGSSAGGNWGWERGHENWDVGLQIFPELVKINARLFSLNLDHHVNTKVFPQANFPLNKNMYVNKNVIIYENDN